MNKILYKFGASWCNPCKMLSETMKSVDLGEIQFVEVDIDQRHDMAKEFGIRSVPTLVLLDVDTGEQKRVSANLTAQGVREFIS